MAEVEQKLCRFCLASDYSHISIFEENVIQEENGQVKQTIEEHFKCEMNELDLLPNFICVECWDKIQLFHVFYVSAKITQENYLKNLVKEEVTDNDDGEYNEDSSSIDDAKFETKICVEILNNSRPSFDEEVSHPKRIKKPPPSQEKPSKIVRKKHKKLDLSLLCKYFDMNCDNCDETFQSLDGAKTHYLNAHNNPNGYLKCCRSKYRNRCFIQDHLEWHLNPDRYKCSLCDKRMDNKIKFQKHQRAHVNKELKPFICDVCGKSFARKAAIQQHILVSHARIEFEYECELCHKRFPIKERLKTHMSSVHHSVARICEVCGKSCRTKKMLQTHLLTHVDKNLKTGMPCKYCGEILQSPSGIYYHKQLHTSGPQKCNECTMELPNRNALQDHVRSHHRARKHKCNYCDKTYMTPYKLRLHVESHTGQGQYRCPYCPMIFKLSSSRRSHCTRTHVDEWNRDRVQKNFTFDNIKGLD